MRLSPFCGGGLSGRAVAVGCHFYVIFYDGRDRSRSRQYPMQWQKTGEGGREGATAAFGFRSPLYLIDNIERGGLRL